MTETKSARQYYDKIAASYESMADSEVLDVRLTKEVAKVFERQNWRKGSILDLGCGPGNLKTKMSGEFGYTGVDVSPNMLEIAKGKGYSIIENTIENALPEIPDKSFDFVVASGSLLFVQDIEKIIPHLDRIAK